MNTFLYSGLLLNAAPIWLAKSHTMLGILAMVIGAVLIVNAILTLIKSKAGGNFDEDEGQDVEDGVTVAPGHAGAVTAEPENEYIAVCSVQGDRNYQQDCYLVSDRAHFRKAGRLAIVCDGMGGLESGEAASNTCVQIMNQVFYDLNRDEPVEDVEKLLKETVIPEADRAVANLKKEDGTELNSGTTMVAVVLRPENTYWASTGDSRIYLIDRKTIRQITRDHNLRLVLRQQVKAGSMTEEEMEAEPHKEALISYIGSGGDLIVDTGTIEFTPGQKRILLLCTDGVYKYLSDKEIQDIVMQNSQNLNVAAAKLIEKALGKPAKHDNITAMLIG